MNNWFEKLKYYYDNKLWDEARVARAVELGKITQEEYEMIVSAEVSSSSTKTKARK